jgi:predicted RND superfamily exporter protein
MFKWVSEIVVRLPWVFISLFLLASIFFGSFIRNAEIEPDIKRSIPPDHPCRISTDRVEEIFGGTLMIMAVITADDVLNPDTLKRTKEISKRMKRLSQVDRVLSLFELKDIRGEDGEMLVDPAVKRIPRTDAEREKLRESLRDNDLVYGNVVARDFTATAVIGMLRVGVSDNELISAVKRVIAEVPGPEPVELGGMPYVRTIVGQDMQDDMKFFMSFGLFIMLVFLFICFRQLRGVVLPFLVVVMSAAFSLGLIPIMGWKIHVLTVLFPVMLIAIANDYGIHLIAKYQEDNSPGNTLNSKDMAKRMIQDLGKPVMFTAVTTMAGMLCLLSHVMIPAKQLGILASIGIAYAFLGSTTFIPAVIAIMPKARPIFDLKKETSKRPALDQGLFFIARFVSRRPKLIIVLTVVTVAAVSTGIYFLEVETNLVNFYSSDAPVARSANMVNKYFGGNASISVVAEGDIKDPDILGQIDHLERSLEDLPNVGTTASLARLIIWSAASRICLTSEPLLHLPGWSGG